MASVRTLKSKVKWNGNQVLWPSRVIKSSLCFNRPVPEASVGSEEKGALSDHKRCGDVLTYTEDACTPKLRVCVQSSAVSNTVTPLCWSVASQEPLSMKFSRQESCSGLLFPTPRDLPDPGIEPVSLCLLHWQVDSLPLCHLESPPVYLLILLFIFSGN